MASLTKKEQKKLQFLRKLQHGIIYILLHCPVPKTTTYQIIIRESLLRAFSQCSGSTDIKRRFEDELVNWTLADSPHSKRNVLESYRTLERIFASSASSCLQDSFLSLFLNLTLLNLLDPCALPWLLPKSQRTSARKEKKNGWRVTTGFYFQC